MQKEGESGRRKMNQITRYLTVVVLVLQAPAYLTQIPNQAKLMAPTMFLFSSVIILTAGTIFVMWLGERITDKGIGNGISLIIMIGIIARLPFAISSELSERLGGQGGLVAFLVEIVFLFLVFVISILLVQGTRRIPVQYAKRIVGNKQYGGVRQYIPLKVNAAGVMPIIFAQAIMFLPTLFSFTNFETGKGIARIFNDPSNFWYMVIYAVMVIAFTFLYTALIFNPKQMADNLKQNNGFIPGVKPGQPTADYIGQVMDRITLPGAIFLAIVGILPGIAQQLKVTQSYASFFGGTSLLIMVGVVLDTLQQIETHLLMRQYDGLMNSGRIQGRQPATTSSI
jgi:preprotein translocase subunit SecY